MNVETSPICDHGITPIQLSAWHDGDLPEAEMARIAEHMRGCPACQARLATYEATARALRGQRVPRADDRLWRAVAAGMAGERARRPVRVSALRPRAVWSGIAAMAALVLIVASFAYAFTQHSGQQSRQTPTAQPTPPQLHLAWTRVTLPAGVVLGANLPYGLTVAGSDGDTAYACATPRDTSGHLNPADPGGKIKVWVTHDRAATWAPATNVPLARTDATACWLQVDDNDSATIVAQVTWQLKPSYVFDEQSSATFISRDGGATWTQLSDPSLTQIVDFASAGGTMYALAWIPFTNGNGSRARLFASTDGLRTWREIDSSLLATESLGVFNVRPDTGEILLQTYPGTVPVGRNVTHLWISRDGGTSWTQQSVPDAERFMVSLLVAGQSWRLCGDNYEANGDPLQPTALACSSDGGKKWASRPVLQPIDPRHAIVYAGMTTSGDLLATDYYSTTQLFRLVPGAGQWQSLGEVPGSANVTYAPAAQSSGVLWAMSGGTNIATTDTIQVYTTSFPPG